MKLLPELWKLIFQKLSIHDILNARSTCQKFKTFADNTRHPFLKKFTIIQVERGCRLMGLWIEEEDQELLIDEYIRLQELPTIGLMSDESLYTKLVWNQFGKNCQYEWINENHRKHPHFKWDEKYKMYFIM